METQTLTPELSAALRRGGATDAGLELIERIRSSTAPVRRVKNGRSVLVRLPSFIERKVLTLESEREAQFAMLLDASPTTLAISEQPCVLVVQVAVDGEMVVVKTVPDIHVIEEAGADDEGPIAKSVFYEVSDDADMRSLQLKDPARYTFDGEWRDLYIEQYVRDVLGGEYRIVTAQHLPPVLIRNRSHLRDLTIEGIAVPEEIRVAVKDAVTRRPSSVGARLLEWIPGLDPMHLDQLYIDRDIWFAADRELLKDLEQVHFFPGRDVGLAVLTQPVRPVNPGDLDLSIGAEFKWGEVFYKIVNADREKLECVVDGKFVALPVAEVERRYRAGEIMGQARAADPAAALAHASPAATAGFLRRVKRLRAAELTGRSDRHVARLRRRVESAARIDGIGTHALVPSYGNCGWRGSRITPDDREHALATIAKQYLTPEQRTLSFAYRAYCTTFGAVVRAKHPGAKPMSWPTFCKILRENWTAEDIARERQGARAANTAAMRAPLGGGRGAYAGVPHTDRANETSHVDETEYDIWLRDSVTGEARGRPWGGLEVDVESTKIMCFVVGFHDPSSASALELLRTRIDEHGSLSECIFTDNAKYHGSTAVVSFANFFGTTLRRRPPASGRTGSEVEAAFNWFNSFVRNLAGSNKPNQRPRTLDSDLAPERRALWTLPEFEEIARRAIRERNARPDPVTGKSPDQRYAESVARTGIRPLRRVRLTREIRLLTAAPRKNGKKFLVGRQGVNVDGVNYWCEEFRHIQGQYVEVKDEPWDITTKYAFVLGEWRDCRN